MLSKLRIAVLSFSLVTLGVSAALATTPGLPWVKVAGLYGGRTQSVAADSTGTLYAATVWNGLFVSTDGGVTWSQTNGLQKANVASGVVSIALDSSNNIYAATISGVFRSVDKGANFTLLNQGAAPLSHARRLLFRKNGDLLATSDAGLSILPAGSQLWTKAQPIPTKYPNLLGIAMDPSESTVVVGAYGANSVFITHDFGATWTQGRGHPRLYEWKLHRDCRV